MCKEYKELAIAEASNDAKTSGRNRCLPLVSWQERIQMFVKAILKKSPN